MTSQTTLDHDDPPKIEGTLTSQLEQIAKAHGGKVPIHGRLFAQWLHYAFPRECPFPHKSGIAQSLSLAEFGDGYMVTKEQAQEHAQGIPAEELAETSREEVQWMSQ